MTSTNSFANQLKEKYKDKWTLTTIREDIARKWLMLTLNLSENDIVVNGIGVLDSNKVDETWEGDPKKKYDFYIPKYNMYIDITGTQFTKRQSSSRLHGMELKGSYVAVLGVKYAVGLVLQQYYKAKAVIANIADNEGEIRFITVDYITLLKKKGIAISTKEFAKGENEYILIPWKEFWKPSRFKNWLKAFIK
ncbi:hypothetical protein LS215_0166 [Sulfolobus islandicus L.S.2.15]|uniref:D212 catalytic domain-containing protein n=1 Tax=Saccharolobus islandicus (strain L.S.2.15 / Lassen \|nr:nuclease [Sulfolobus islandicus]ACP34321.1 hypothetical protein LS215_0166 [Sulfolobus islandicus L.S.2.15]